VPSPWLPRVAETCPGASCRRPPRLDVYLPSPRLCGRVGARALPSRGAAVDSCRAGQPAIASRRSCLGADACLYSRRPAARSDDVVRRARVSGRPLARSAAAGSKSLGRVRCYRRRLRPLRHGGGGDAAGIGDEGVPRGPDRPLSCWRVLGGRCGRSWSPAFLGIHWRARLSGPAAAAKAVTLCRRRLRVKLEQLALREAMPPPLRAAFRAHIGAQIAQCAGQVGGPTHAAVAVDRAAARATPRRAPVALRREGDVPPTGTPSLDGRRWRQPHANTAGRRGVAAVPAASECLPRPSATRARSGSALPPANVRAPDKSLGRHGARGLPMWYL